MQRSSTRARAAAATLGLAVAVGVVAMAARAPLSRATPVDARAAQTPTTAVFMLLAGTGIAMVGAFVLVLWSGRRRRDDPPEHAPTRIDVPWIWKVIAVVMTLGLGAALVAAAATGTRSLHTGAQVRAQPPAGGAPLSATPSTGGGGGFAVPVWLPWTVLAIVAVALAAGLVSLWLSRARPTEPVQHGAARAAVEAAIGALDDAVDPRRAVIAAYGAMQRALGERGVVRSPSEAPREYLQRALIASRATEREARTLTELFEEARYSTHPIPERLREAALSAVRSLQRRLQTEGRQ